jgi:hypothetical protein
MKETKLAGTQSTGSCQFLPGKMLILLKIS